MTGTLKQKIFIDFKKSATNERAAANFFACNTTDRSDGNMTDRPVFVLFGERTLNYLRIR